MMNRLPFFLALAIAFTLPVSAASPTERDERATSSRARSMGLNDGLGFRRAHRVGVGVSGAGPLGVGGANLELSFKPDVGILTGFGGGSGFQSFHLQIKKLLGGARVMPYVSFGYARWMGYGGSGSHDRPSYPGYLRSKFLNSAQVKAGEFTENLVYPALGVQYLQLSGPLFGSSLFAEILVLADAEDFVIAPTATLGYMYYF